MKATIATDEFEVITDGDSVRWASTRVDSAMRVAAAEAAADAPLRGMLNAVILGSLLWLFLGAAVWFLI